MIDKLFTIYFFFVVAITSIPLFIVSIILRIFTYPFDRKLRLLHLHTSFWGSLYTWITPGWKIRTFDRGKVRKGATYVVVSNHQSLLDILVAFRLFFHFKWVSKIEIFKVPVIGWNMVLNRYIKIKRGDKDSVKQMMKDSEDRISEGSSPFFFPEGTRSFDGKIKEFKPGAFELAKKMKVPILPIAISGTMKALPKYKLGYSLSRIGIQVLDEIPYEAFADKSVEDLSEMVRQTLIKGLAALEEQLEKDRKG